MNKETISKKRDRDLPRMGFIGQGFIGKNYADDFETRGYTVVRYALEKPYVQNKEAIKDCDIVFIAVPTPTTPNGFDYSIVEENLKLIGESKIAVIKSTVLPGTTEKLQKKYKSIVVLYSPEFLCEATAAHDAANPFSNIIGIAFENKRYQHAAQKVMEVLPKAPFSKICRSTEAEYIKYTHNCLGYIKIVFMNLVRDTMEKTGRYDWNVIKAAMEADPMVSNYYNDPIHKHGRGAGGSCFIKDFAAFTQLYKQLVDDPLGTAVLESNEKKNKQLLLSSKKDLDLLKGVYGTLDLKD